MVWAIGVKCAMNFYGLFIVGLTDADMCSEAIQPGPIMNQWINLSYCDSGHPITKNLKRFRRLFEVINLSRETGVHFKYNISVSYSLKI